LRFVQSTPAIEGTFAIDSPTSWTEINHPNAKINMGTGLYSLETVLPALNADDWILDLGDLRESARIRINGKEAGTVWAAPFQLKVGMAVGSLTLRVIQLSTPLSCKEEMK